VESDSHCARRASSLDLDEIKEKSGTILGNLCWQLFCFLSFPRRYAVILKWRRGYEVHRQIDRRSRNRLDHVGGRGDGGLVYVGNNLIARDYCRRLGEPMTPHLSSMIVLVVGMLLAPVAYGQLLEGRQGYGGSSLTPEALDLPELQQHLSPPLSRPGSYVPPRSPDLGSAFSPSTPSIGSGPELLGPEAGPGASRRQLTPRSDDKDGGRRLRHR
jgi:hypothetical protein